MLLRRPAADDTPYAPWNSAGEPAPGAGGNIPSEGSKGERRDSSRPSGRTRGEPSGDLGPVSKWLKKVRAEIDASPVGTPENDALARELFELIGAHPWTIAGLIWILKNDESFPYEGKCLIMEAIARGGDPGQAYALLADLLSDPSIRQGMKVTALSLVDWPQDPPDERMVAALYTVAEGTDPQLAHSAYVRLGRAAQRLRDRDAARAASIVDRLFSLYEQSERAGDVRLLQMALAGGVESRDPRFEPLIRNALGHSNPAVREGALYTFGRLDSPDRFEVVLNRFSVEPDPNVRAAAIRALMPCPGEGALIQSEKVDRVPAYVHERLAAALVGDPDMRVREEILRYWQYCYQGRDSRAPEVVRQAVVRASQLDPSRGIRSVAANMLKYTSGFIKP